MTKGNTASNAIRVTVSLDADLNAKIQNIRAAVIKQSHSNISFSKVLNTIAILAIKDYDVKDVANTVIAEARAYKK